MNRIILLDSGPLGLLTHPRATPAGIACERWLESILQQGHRVVVPEIIDYELRRELLRGRMQAGLRRLESLLSVMEYQPLTTEIMRLAAELWATARQQGRPTAERLALDIDMILAAQAKTLDQAGNDVVIATTNVRHLALFTAAYEWSTIS